MKSKNISIFVASVILITILAYSAIYGVNIGSAKLHPLSKNIKQGLDLKGGVFVVYEAQTDEKGEKLKKILDQTIEVFRKRIDSMGLTEPIIVKEGDKRIRIELPGAKNAKDAINMIGKTAQLKFMKDDGTVVLTGKEVKKSDVVFDKQKNTPIVSLEFDKVGSQKFSIATKELAGTGKPLLIVLDNKVISSPGVNEQIPNGQAIISGNFTVKTASELANLIRAGTGKPLLIVLDNKVISSPGVNEQIPNGQAIISGNFTVKTASELANLIRAGALPVEFKEVQTSTITATLGEDALKKSVLGAEIGVGIVMIFMLFYYRLSGVVANIALVLYMLIVSFVFVGMKATLTLPGMAALILSVGVAVDANVIIFERIKDEIKNGKSLRASVDSGFAKAFITILDANATQIITGIVLYNFGTGPIKGFAIILMIGIIASMFTAIVFTKLLLKALIHSNITKNSKIFGF